jgi:hypothetical protein
MDQFERDLLTPEPPKPAPIPWRCKRGWHNWGKWSDGKRVTYQQSSNEFKVRDGCWERVIHNQEYILQESYCVGCNLLREQKTKAL